LEAIEVYLVGSECWQGCKCFNIGLLLLLLLQRPHLHWMWSSQFIILSLWKEIKQTLKLIHHLEWKLHSFILMLNTFQLMSFSIILS